MRLNFKQRPLWLKIVLCYFGLVALSAIAGLILRLTVPPATRQEIVLAAVNGEGRATIWLLGAEARLFNSLMSSSSQIYGCLLVIAGLVAFRLILVSTANSSLSGKPQPADWAFGSVVGLTVGGGFVGGGLALLGYL